MLYQRTRRHYGNLNAVLKNIYFLEMRNVNKKSYKNAMYIMKCKISHKKKNTAVQSKTVRWIIINCDENAKQCH